MVCFKKRCGQIVRQSDVRGITREKIVKKGSTAVEIRMASYFVMETITVLAEQAIFEKGRVCQISEGRFIAKALLCL